MIIPDMYAHYRKETEPLLPLDVNITWGQVVKFYSNILIMKDFGLRLKPRLRAAEWRENKYYASTPLFTLLNL